MVKMKKFILTSVLICTCLIQARSQVLLTLLFGDKLNSDKLEFGLSGGVNFSNISNLPDSPDTKALAGFHLGFYFDIKITEPLFIHTGVIVKSPLGARNLTPYDVGDDDLDSISHEASVNRVFRQFTVPILLRYYPVQDRFFLEGGLQLGLLYRAIDEFKYDVFEKEDLVFKNDVTDLHNKIDAGLAAGIGFKLAKKLGMRLGARYYAGLTDVLKDNPSSKGALNSSVYVYASLPVGRGKAAEKKTTKERVEE